MCSREQNAKVDDLTIMHMLSEVHILESFLLHILLLHLRVLILLLRPQLNVEMSRFTLPEDCYVMC